MCIAHRLTRPCLAVLQVWNMQNGHSLQQLEAVDECEVTGVVAVPERKSILAVGWSRRIVQYSDTEPDVSNMTYNFKLDNMNDN